MRRPGRAASARSAPLGAPRALRPGAAPRSNTAPPAAARGPPPLHWPRRPARRAPIGCGAARPAAPGPSARAVLPTSCFIPQCRGAARGGEGGAGGAGAP